MITIIHGDDLAASRDYFVSLKEKSKEPKEVVLSSSSIEDLKQIIEGGSLFFEEKDLFLENLLSQRKSSKNIAEVLKYLQEHEKSINLVDWEDKELTKAATSIFKTAEVKVFKLPQSLFQFLDSIKPNNSMLNIRFFHDALQNSTADAIFYMIVRQFRLMLALSIPLADGIDETKRLAPWQRGKLERQARLFSEKELKSAYHKIYKIDLGLKTGGIALDFEKAIDFFLLNI